MFSKDLIGRENREIDFSDFGEFFLELFNFSYRFKLFTLIDNLIGKNGIFINRKRELNFSFTNNIDIFWRVIFVKKNSFFGVNLEFFFINKRN
jgi:hypothetical protein